MASKHVRLGGLAAVLGGALLLAADGWSVIQEVLGAGSAEFSEVVQTTGWTVMSAMLLTGGLLLPLGLVALYVRQAEAAGVLGLVGFVAASIGTALVIGAIWAMTFVAPSVAIEAPAFLNAEQQPGPLSIGFVSSFSAFAVGWALFGAAMFRARVFSRMAAVALALGALVSFAPLPGSALVFDVALIWVGYSLWSEQRSAQPAPPEPAPTQAAVGG